MHRGKESLSTRCRVTPTTPSHITQSITSMVHQNGYITVSIHLYQLAKFKHSHYPPDPRTDRSTRPPAVISIHHQLSHFQAGWRDVEERTPRMSFLIFGTSPKNCSPIIANVAAKAAPLDALLFFLSPLFLLTFLRFPPLPLFLIPSFLRACIAASFLPE